MNPRERFRFALNHKEGDRIPIDLGFDVHKRDLSAKKETTFGMVS